MIMSNDFQFQYAYHCSLPYISYKMKCAPWLCIYNFDAIDQSFVVDNKLFFFRVRHLKIREKRINTPLCTNICWQIAPSCTHLIGRLKSCCNQHINNLPAVPGMSVYI